MATIHPELKAVRFVPPVSWGPRLIRIMRGIRPRPADPGADVVAREVTLPGSNGNPDVSVRVLRPALASSATPVLLWVHGGGLIMGSPEQDDRTTMAFVRNLGITVVAVRYRLAPQSKAPAAAEDVYTALGGIRERADELGIDPARIAIGGASAGGGLAAAVVQMAHDRHGPDLVFQLLVYPMLDDRTVVRPGIDRQRFYVWSPKSNLYGWQSYLGLDPGSADVPPYAAPARRDDLSGLPPAWIGVGELDMFKEEDVEYARRLKEAGVECTLQVVPGAFHGFDALFGKSEVARQFWRDQAAALRDAFAG